MLMSAIGGVLKSVADAVAARLLGGLQRATIGEGQVADGHFSSIAFDGANDYLLNNTVQTYDIGASFTLSVWVKLGTLSDSDLVFSMDDADTTNKNRILLWLEAGSEWSIFVSDSSAASASATVTGVPVTGKWINLVGVKDGTTSLKIYLNGTLEDTNTTSIPTTTDATNRLLAICGASKTAEQGNNLMDADVHSAALWDVALDINAVREIFNQGAGGMFDLSRDEGDYTSSADLQHWWKFGEDTSDLGADSGTAGAIDLDTDAVSIDGTDIIFEAPDAGYILFDGSADYLLNSTTQAYDVGGSFSIGGWVNLTTVGANDSLIDIVDNITDDKNRIQLHLNGSSNWTFHVTDSSTFAGVATAGGVAVADAWYHVMGVKNGTTSMKIYVNGEEVGDDTASVPTTTDVSDRVGAIAGEARANDVGTNLMPCKARDIGLWDIALSEAAVQDIYNGGHKDFDLRAKGKSGGYTSHGSLKHWFRCGRPLGSVGAGGDYFADQVASGGIDLSANDSGMTVADIGIADSGSGLATDLNGSTEYFANTTKTAPGFANAWSWSIWCRPDALTAVLPLLYFIPTTASQCLTNIVGSTANDPLKIMLWDSGGTLFKNYLYDSVFTVDVWTHILFTWDGSTLLLYIDGTVFTATTLTTDDAGTMDDSARETWVGNFGSDYFSGDLGHYAIWSAALSADAARQVWAGGQKADLLSARGAYSSQASLQHWWKLGEDPDDLGKDYGSAGTLIDIDDNSSGITRQADFYGRAP